MYLPMAINMVAWTSYFVQYHKRYLERCKYHNDDEGVGNAYEALARSFERYVYMYCYMYKYQDQAHEHVHYACKANVFCAVAKTLPAYLYTSYILCGHKALLLSHECLLEAPIHKWDKGYYNMVL